MPEDQAQPHLRPFKPLTPAVKALTWLASLKAWAKTLRRDIIMITLMVRHPKTPLIARIILYGTLCYALSPIDLIPDFIPVIGFLDELILLPALIAFAIHLTPKDVTTTCRQQAAETPFNDPRLKWLGALMIISLWLVALKILWHSLHST